MKIVSSIKKHNATACLIGTAIAACLTFAYAGESQGTGNIVPPVAKTVPKIDTIHGDVLVDNYFWLRQRNDPKVLEYLRAENAYTTAKMKHTEAFQQKLYEEMLSKYPVSGIHLDFIRYPGVWWGLPENKTLDINHISYIIIKRNRVERN